MSVNELKELKIQAARKKLKKYQRKKEQGNSSSLDRTPTEIGLFSSKSSSRCSSVSDNLDMQPSEANKEFTKEETFIPIASEESVKNSTLLTSNLDVKTASFNANCFEGSTNGFEEVIHAAPVEEANNTPQHMNDCSDSENSEDTLPTVREISQNPVKSTAESLRQLTLQMSGLINDAEGSDTSGQQQTILELEKRNSELAVYLQSERNACRQQLQITEDLKRQLTASEQTMESLRHSNAEANSDQVSGLREQLQIHIQTIGILVAEKSELQSNLAHLKHTLSQTTGEREDLKSRLDVSRHRVAELESQIKDLIGQLATLQTEKKGTDEQYTNLHTNYCKMSQFSEELRASVAELTERLSVKVEENQHLSKEVYSLREKLDLKEVHIKQLRDSTSEDMQSQVETLRRQHDEDVAQIQFIKTSLEQSLSDRAKLEMDYKNYTASLLNESTMAKNQLKLKSEEMEKALEINGELLKQASMHAEYEALVKRAEEFESVKSKLEDDLKQSVVEHAKIQEKCDSLNRDNGQLSLLVADLSQKLERLENDAEMQNSEKRDTKQLLHSMESDKVAAASALKQNKILKERLEEFEKGLILLTNKKLEVTEKLENELFNKKGLHKEMAALGEEVSDLREKLLSRDREIRELRSNSYNECVNNSENQPQLLNTSSYMHSINGCVSENADLHSICEGHDHHEHDHHEHEHHEVTIEKKEIDIPPENSENLINDRTTDAKDEFSCSNEVIPSETIEPQELEEKICNLVSLTNKSAYVALEKRFLSCMNDLANVTEENKQLEYIVEQLRLETDTVGDYITIYQFQRGALRQQIIELTDELDLMKTEKEDVYRKLGMLQKLVSNLTRAEREDIAAGLSSLINCNQSNSPDEEKALEKDSTNETISSDNVKSAINDESHAKCMHGDSSSIDNPSSRVQTVQKIKDILSEIEVSKEIDLSSLHKFHPCPHCSGKLINV